MARTEPAILLRPPSGLRPRSPATVDKTAGTSRAICGAGAPGSCGTAANSSVLQSYSKPPPCNRFTAAQKDASWRCTSARNVERNRRHSFDRLGEPVRGELHLYRTVGVGGQRQNF